MSKYVDEAKKKLGEFGFETQVLQATINLYLNPDNEQKLSEEIFRLREENEVLSYEKEELKQVTLEFVSEIKSFLLEISTMNYDECDFKHKFKNLQNRTKETYKILELMEMLNE